eukprot:3278412-Rhodomonas_salina.1
MIDKTVPSTALHSEQYSTADSILCNLKYRASHAERVGGYSAKSNTRKRIAGTTCTEIVAPCL